VLDGSALEDVTVEALVSDEAYYQLVSVTLVEAQEL
jgi:hypothetical protein